MAACAGNWTLLDHWSLNPEWSGYDNFSGFENDDPTWVKTVSGFSLIAVGSDNRTMAATGVAGAPNNILYASSKIFTKNDPNCITVIVNPHDCINGNCIPSTQYGTPGLFATLALCQSKCSLNNGCDGRCIPNNEWAQIESLASQLAGKC